MEVVQLRGAIRPRVSPVMSYRSNVDSMTYLIVTLVFGVLGLITARWLIVIVPPIVWTVVAVGINHRWWGRPPGEFLVLGTLLLGLFGMLAATVGVLVRRSLARLASSRRESHA